MHQSIEPIFYCVKIFLYCVFFDAKTGTKKNQGFCSTISDNYDNAAMTWSTRFDFGDISGIASCNGELGGIGVVSDSAFEQSATGGNCWCKMTSPSESYWVWNYKVVGSPMPTEECSVECAYKCSSPTSAPVDFRSAMFGSVGN